MKVGVLVRTRNEEKRIWQFCNAYRDADYILVADGGSEDNTIRIAKSFPNVEVRKYTKRVLLQGGYWRNNDSDHSNFLFEWSREPEYGLDWVIYDDCDCRPNYKLRLHYRKILDETEADYVMAVRLYLWDKYLHFPDMAKPGENHDKWEASLWAWRTDQDFWTVDDNFPHFSFRIGDKPVKDLHFDAKTIDLMPPYCLLHTSWMDKKHLENKLLQHRAGGSIPNIRHPLEYAGKLEILPEWAYEL